MGRVDGIILGPIGVFQDRRLFRDNLQGGELWLCIAILFDLLYVQKAVVSPSNSLPLCQTRHGILQTDLEFPVVYRSEAEGL